MPKFEPIRLNPPPENVIGKQRLVVTCTLKGDIVEEFEKMVEEHGLNRSQLVLQMVHHCLGRSKELKDFYKRLAILGN